MKIALLSHVGKEYPNSKILSLEMDLIPVLVRMQKEGILIDQKKLREIGENLRASIRKIETEVRELVGESINLSSPKQVAELLQRLGIPLTKKNKTGFSVDTDVLEELAGKHDIARLILDHRSYSKLVSTYVDALLKSVNPTTKRVHTHYNQIGASTGRMSSEDPNLQNIPTGSGYAHKIKSYFIPKNGSVLLVADYSQIELRILAFLSGDPALRETFIRGEDIHARTAHFLF